MKHPDLQMDWLRAFVAVVDAGSLSAAAPLVHRSQSAVSMQIKKLESALGQTVLLRGPRHMTLTPTGAELLVYARRMLDLQSEAQSALMGPQLVGKIRLGVPDDYASNYITPVLKRFAGRYPGVQIDLSCEQSTALIPQVRRGELDLVLVSLEPKQQQHTLFREPLVWVADPQYQLWQRSPLPVASYEHHSLAHIAARTALKRHQRAYRMVYHSASLAGQLAAVESGLAVAVLTRCSVPSRLTILGDEHNLPPLEPMQVGVLRSQASQSSSAVDAMYEQMLQTIRTCKKM